MSGCGFITCYDTVGKEECCDIRSDAAEAVTQQCYDAAQHNGHSDADSIDHHCSNRSCQERRKENVKIDQLKTGISRNARPNEFSMKCYGMSSRISEN